ncbi:MAG: hypothetical protein KFF50_13140, partial [Desulfatitalea sp.]|nr:hypothetical protein [Desulfatitalea sp.]
MNTKKNTSRRWPLVLLALIILALAVFLFIRLEGQPPTVTLALDRPALGAQQTLTLHVADAKSGIRSVWAAVETEGREVVVFDRTFPSAGIWAGGVVREETVLLPFAPRDKGIADGPA